MKINGITNPPRINNSVASKVNNVAISRVGVWSAGGNLNTARMDLAGAGTQTEGLSFCGRTAQNSLTQATEEYNGSSWTSQNGFGEEICRPSGFGTQSAGTSCGGQVTYEGRFYDNYGYINTTKEYDGTQWAVANGMSVSRSWSGGAGTQSAGMTWGGYTQNFSPIMLQSTEEYNGTTWSSGGDILQSIFAMASAGLQTSGLSVGGDYNSYVFSYDGATWSSETSLSFPMTFSKGFGLQTECAVTGGTDNEAIIAKTCEYNGSVWVLGGNLATARSDLGCSGSQSAGLAFGGSTYLASTEEYNK